MIRIVKSKTVPASLDSDLTKQRRDELIAAQKFVNEPKFSSRYRLDDIKLELQRTNPRKCLYCEQTIQESMEVEHFRPKYQYYWLAYSWDNLFWCCQKCNRAKGTKFPIDKGRKVKLNLDFSKAIHNSCGVYDKKEKILLINPSVEPSPQNHFSFNEKGEMKGETINGRIVVKVCKLNRNTLNDRRKEVFDDLKKELEMLRLEKNVEGILRVISAFKESAKNSQSEFVAFRLFIAKHFLKKLI